MPRPWWHQGVRFECQGTGRCCISRGRYGFVYLTLEDRRRLAKHFGLSTQSFTRRHCARTEGFFHLKTVEGPCQYLEGTRCGVYEARPGQCRTWPFWPENMSPRIWNREIAPFCAGVGKGPVRSEAEIRRLLVLGQ